MPPAAELHARTNFTFLTGASHPDELVEQAHRLGLSALAVTDVNTLAGVVRAHVAAKTVGLPLRIGAEVHFRHGPRAVLLAMSRRGYAHLSHLLTIGRMRVPKGECEIVEADLDHHGGLHRELIAILLDPDPRETLRRAHTGEARPGTAPLTAATLGQWRERFGDRLYAGLTRQYRAGDVARTRHRAEMAGAAGVPTVVVGGVEMHVRERKPLHDVLACIREKVVLETAGWHLLPNAEAVLRGPEALATLFHDMPDALARTVEIAERTAGFSLDELRFEYPDEYVPRGQTPADWLRELTERGAARRYPDGVPQPVRDQIEHELALIAELAYEPYFLTIHDVVNFARKKNILCQGRGSSANSAVCYCLGITEVNPATSSLLFERFLSRERNEPPDIDVDFEHEQREKVIQYVYEKYTRDHAAMVCEVIRYRGRSALREVGKALGLSLDQVARLAKLRTHWSEGVPDAHEVRRMGFDAHDRRVALTLTLAAQIQDFPRHLGIHVGGFVITRGPLHELVPIENATKADRTVIQWDKDDAEALGLLKVDCLSLGMLTAIRKCFEMIHETVGHRLSLADLPDDDPATWQMIQQADTVGVFQIESRGQMSMLVRLKPASYYDLVIEVAIMRPGPIQGGMVHPYLRRRQGIDPVEYPIPQLEPVLKRTLGVPLFQEQCMQLAVVAAGFTPGEADGLRRAMAAWRRRGSVDTLRERLINGMMQRGIEGEYAERIFQQIAGFGDYGFPESHAASFALLAWASSFLKCHYPAQFIASVINSQPMGFYSASSLVQDVKRHGVEVRPIDVTISEYDCTIENAGTCPVLTRTPGEKTVPHAPSLRLGLRVLKGMSKEKAEKIVDARACRPFSSVADFAHRTRVGRKLIQRLANGGALSALRNERRQAIWDATWDHATDADEPLFRGLEPPGETPELIPCSEREIVASDYATTGLSLHAHPIALLRDHPVVRDLATTADIRSAPDGAGPLRVAGLVQTRQRPGTAKGVTFITLEDEFGTCQLIIWKAVFDRFREEVCSGRSLLATGRVQNADNVVNMLVERLETLDRALQGIPTTSRDFG